MEDSFRHAYVYVRDCYAGILSETDSGYTFSYDAEYLQQEDASAVSLTIPLRAESYSSSILFPFFDGLIPEGWLLDAISRNWKIAVAPVVLMLILFIFVPALNAGTVGIMVPVSVLFTIAVSRLLYKRGVL